MIGIILSSDDGRILILKKIKKKTYFKIYIDRYHYHVYSKRNKKDIDVNSISTETIIISDKKYYTSDIKRVINFFKILNIFDFYFLFPKNKKPLIATSDSINYVIAIKDIKK